MHLLFLFFDGIGLGDPEDRQQNPFNAARTPTLNALAGGQTWNASAQAAESDRAIFIPTDANLGVEGKPQSATGQASIMTGLNVPAMVGQHYGPKPSPEVAAIIREGSVAKRLAEAGLESALLNVYASAYLAEIERGKRLASANQMAMLCGGVAMLDGAAYLTQRGFSPDFTGQMWRDFAARHDEASTAWLAAHPGESIPTSSARESGHRIAARAQQVAFSFMDIWVTDYLGHRGRLEEGVGLLETVDEALAGLLEAWDDEQGSIIISSDHGNLEDLSQRGHTRNLVPTVLIGAQREKLAEGLSDLTHITPAILRFFGL